MGKIINNISVDCVLFGFDGTHLNVLLIERTLKNKDGGIQFTDHTLLGYHINKDDNLDQAANRILYDLTGLKDIYLEQVIAAGNLDRMKSKNDKDWIASQDIPIDPHTVTVVYFSLVDTHKVIVTETNRNATWFPIHKLPQLGYDHKELVERSLEKLKMKAMLEPIVFELLPEKFTITQLQKAYETILDTTFDRRNFRKKLMQTRYIIALDEKQTGVAHKPAQLYFFSREVYEKTYKERFLIPL